MRRFGDLLLGLGVLVGIGAVVGYELDIIPTLPPELLKLVIYKLAFIGGLGLLVTGAVIRRLAGRGSESSHGKPVGGTTSGPQALPEARQDIEASPAGDLDVELLRREP